MASVFIKIRAWSDQASTHGQAVSTREMGKLRVELGFNQNTNVVGISDIYNFHEEKFFKFRTDFKVKLNLKKTGQENRKFLHRIFKALQD